MRVAAASSLTTCARAGGCASFNYPFLTRKERDNETNLDYFGERYFSSTLGRFTTPDPLGGSIRASNPQTMNRYTYVLNNPLRYVDPNGLQEKDAWDQLTDAERKAIASKLQLKKGETARGAFNNLVTVSGDNTATAANVQSVQNFIAQAGGLKNSETWQQISAITKVTPQGQAPLDINKGMLDSTGRQSSDLEITVADKGKFLTALQKDPMNSFVVDSLGDEALKKAGLSWHPFNNARATTDYRSDPQLHYSNDRSNDSNYGPNYFFVHWDPTSSSGRKSTVVGDVRGGLGHGPRGTVGQVTDYLKRTQQAPRQ